MNRYDPKPFSVAILSACTEARRWLGATTPNPPVGAAALDENGTLLAVAAHQKAGQDHAEAALLKLCREQNLLPRLHTVCVTLEPCNHHGRTLPCTEALIAAGVKRVVVGNRDPNPRVKGGGNARLRAAGIEVIEDVENESCRRLIHAFACHATTGKPFITVKRAFDSNGSMIPPQGQKTFTAPESLKLAHHLRKKADAILTGSGTILADHPLFTIRHVPDHPAKRRILAILDRSHRVPQTYLQEANARGFDAKIYTDLDACLHELSQQGISDILVESGPNLSQSILESQNWHMGVDIHKSAPDKIETRFAPHTSQLFDPTTTNVYSLLPIHTENEQKPLSL